MAITNATRLSDFAAGIGTEGAILKIDNANQRVGIGTQLPNQMLTVAGNVSATQFIGDGSLLEGIKSAGLGTAISDIDGSAGAVVYYTDDLLTVSETTTVNPPASASAAYTQYRDIKLEDNADLIIETGDDFIPDILGLGTDSSDPNAAGNGVFDEVYSDIIKNKDGLGAPAFANGLTSVGVITATGGFSGNVTGNVTGSVTGSGANLTNLPAGQLTGDLPAISGANLTGIDAAPTASGVANGSIGVGTAVAVQSDGKFVAVTGTNSFHSGSVEYTPDSTSRNRVVYAPDVDKLVTSYVGYSDDKTYTVVGTASADGKTVTWDNGNKSQPNGGSVSAYQDICYDTANNKVICVFRDEGSRIDSAVGTISGTSITWGSLDTLDSAGSNSGCSVAFDSSTGTLIAVWRATSTTYELRAGTVSGTNITWGTVVTATTGDTANVPHIAAENGHFVITGRDNYHVGSYSGTTITMAAAEGTIPFSDGNTSTDDTPITVDPATSTYLMGGCRDYTDKYPEVFAATRSGTTLTFGDGKVLNQMLSYNLALCPAGLQNKFFASWGYSNTSGYSAVLEVVGTKITMSEPYKYISQRQEIHGSSGCVFNPDKGAVVLVWCNEGDSRDGWYYVEGMRNTTGTRGGFVGFSNAAYTNGQTAKVSIAGAISTNQSGLTAAQPYYLKGDGTLDTSPASGDFLVGNALSATNLLLR